MTKPAHIVLLAAGAAAAVSTLAHAAGPSRRDALLNRSALEPADAAPLRAAPTGWPTAPDGAPLGASGRGQFGGADLSSRFGAVARGGWGADGALSTMDTGFESLAPLPANLVGQQDTVIWGGGAASVTGRPVFGPVSPGVLASQYGVVADPIAGNATKKLRGVADPASAPGSFFGRWCRYELVHINSAGGGVGARFVFTPTLEHDVRVSHDIFLTSIDTLWTSEPTNVLSGFIVARLLWGGENSTTGIGLPVGPITEFYTLGPENAVFISMFLPCTTPASYRSGAPFPGGAGHNVPVPVNAWFTIIHETTADGRVRHVLDLHDGQGEFVVFDGFVHSNPSAARGRVDRVAFASAFESAGDACYIDNLHIEGGRLFTCLRPQGDLDYDGDVDFADLNTVLAHFGEMGAARPGDVNNDGVVNFADLNLVLANFGATC